MTPKQQQQYRDLEPHEKPDAACADACAAQIHMISELGNPFEKGAKG